MGNVERVVKNRGKVVANVNSVVGKIGRVVGNVDRVEKNRGKVVADVNSVVGKIGRVAGNVDRVVKNRGQCGKCKQCGGKYRQGCG